MARKFYTGIDLQNQRGVNAADPTVGTDLANKQYVDNVAAGLQWKLQVKAATTANISLTAPGASFDGVTLAANDRVLVKDQTDSTQNGLYRFVASGSALVRTTDADNDGELAPGTAVTVTQGTVNGDRIFLIISDAPITIGTTAQTWGIYGGAAVTYSAGLGLTQNGTVFSIDTTIVTRKFAANVPASTAPAFTHNLGTTDVQVTVFIIATGEEIECDKFHTSSNVVTLGFASAPAAGTLRVAIQG